MEARLNKLKRLREIATAEGMTDKVIRANILIKQLLGGMAERAGQRFVVQQGVGAVTYIR